MNNLFVKINLNKYKNIELYKIFYDKFMKSNNLNKIEDEKTNYDIIMNIENNIN